MMQHMVFVSKYFILPLSLLVGVTTLALQLLFTDEFLKDVQPNSQYDYIIVGAGTAGCVLASKLSKNPTNKVLLIEAGDRFTYFSSVPLLSTTLQGSKYDWAFKTVPQFHSSFGFNNNTQFLPRGKGLGGSAMINYMIHGDMVPGDLEQWNVSKWNYNRISEYINKQLTKDIDCIPYTLSTSGFCPVTNIKENKRMYLSDSNCELTGYYHRAVKELNDNQVRFENTNLTVVEGKRWTSYDAYLKPALHRNNLQILLNAKVLKILMKNNTAIGVQILNSGKIMDIYTNKDVVLSAGALHTPQILLLSGIGRKEQLKKLGVDVTVELLGVGENLHDHLNMPLYVSIESPQTVTVDKILTFGEIWNYIFYGTGVYATTPMAGSMRGPGSISLLLFAMGSTDEKLLREIVNYNPETFKAIFPLYKNSSQEGFVLLSSCLQPKSRGSVFLENSDPFKLPLIDPNYLSDHEDIDCIIKAMHYAMKIMNTPTFKQLGAKIHWPLLKSCQHLPVEPLCEDYLECLIRNVALTSHHPAGTCQIGDDANSVVDSSLRVHGVRGLRVLDASILKYPLSTYPNDVLITLAEYGAHLILESNLI